mmetsp:Transcript_30198/g.48757  ORF Transcript_30198/g.48757 Transcript_30198/m.48757 type:complete len:242 (-) Transcript_30198:154-879(-)
MTKAITTRNSFKSTICIQVGMDAILSSFFLNLDSLANLLMVDSLIGSLAGFVASTSISPNSWSGIDLGGNCRACFAFRSLPSPSIEAKMVPGAGAKKPVLSMLETISFCCSFLTTGAASPSLRFTTCCTSEDFVIATGEGTTCGTPIFGPREDCVEGAVDARTEPLCKSCRSLCNAWFSPISWFVTSRSVVLRSCKSLSSWLNSRKSCSDSLSRFSASILTCNQAASCSSVASEASSKNTP